MNGYLWRNLIVMIPSGLAMLFGIIHIFPKSKGLYFRMGVFGMVCLFAGFVYSLTAYLTDISTGSIVNLGVLGNIGLALFLMAQNADSISSMLYEHGKKFNKKAGLAVCSPIIIAAVWLGCEAIMYLKTENHNLFYWFGTVFALGVCAVLNAITAFYTLRYSLSESEDNGLIDCLRPYNRVMTVLLVLLTPEYFIRNMTVNTVVGGIAVIIYYSLLAVCVLAVLPLMERGRVRFLTSL